MTNQQVSYPERLQHLKSVLGDFSTQAPHVSRAFGELHKSAVQPGALDERTKELIALSIAVASRCDGCVAFHAHDALRAGATPAEIADALGVAVLMGGGPSLVYATHAVEAVQQFAGRGSNAVVAESVDPSKTAKSAYIDSCHHFD